MQPASASQAKLHDHRRHLYPNALDPLRHVFPSHCPVAWAGGIYQDKERHLLSLPAQLLCHLKGDHPANGTAAQQIRPFWLDRLDIFEVIRGHGLNSVGSALAIERMWMEA